LAAAGSELVYSTYLGGSTDFNLGSTGDAGFGIALDGGSNVYVTGYTDSSDFPTKNAFQRGIGSTDGNAFVTKLDAAGTALVYSTYLGGSFRDQANGISVDTHDDAYITGRTQSPDFPAKNAFQGDLKSGGGNAFITKFDAAGTALVYSSYLGGSAPYPGDSGNGIAVDASGNAYVTGSTLSTDFPTKNAFQDKLKSAKGNAFVTKISAE